MIRYEAVSKQYPDGTTAVHDLTLEASSHQITVLVGPSGCGKTTSVRMVNRMIDPSAGRVRIDDRDVSSVKPAQLSRGIGYVIQQAGLFPNKTVLGNIATVPRLLGQTRQAARRTATGLLDRVGLPTELATRYPAQLSGGQQHRVGVARALAAHPPITLMNEPFSAADPVVREQLQNEFLRLQGELGKTIIFVPHDVDEAIKLGDRVAVMRAGGTLARFAPPAELLTCPADAFVAGFVGRDRGYRALGFTAAGELPPADEKPVHICDAVTIARDRERDGWTLVVDDGDAPLGWVVVGGLPNSALRGEVTSDLLNVGGTLASVGGTLRESLDAALSSLGRRGVVIDVDGRFAGTVTAAQVLSRIERAPERKQGHEMSSLWHRLQANQARIEHWAGTTIWLTLAPLLIGFALALPTGWLAARYRWVYSPLTGITGVLYTIPSLVMFLVLPTILNMRTLDPVNVGVALTVYAYALLVRSVADALRSVPAELLAASKLSLGAPAPFQTVAYGTPALAKTYGVTFGRFGAAGTHRQHHPDRAAQRHRRRRRHLLHRPGHPQGRLRVPDRPTTDLRRRGRSPAVQAQHPHPAMADAANAVSAKPTTNVLTTLDTKVADGTDPATIASECLKQQGLA
jgi:osmoprotectant transport system ATP-binding protein